MSGVAVDSFDTTKPRASGDGPYGDGCVGGVVARQLPSSTRLGVAVRGGVP
jgi:hypothetical protein